MGSSMAVAMYLGGGVADMIISRPKERVYSGA